MRGNAVTLRGGSKSSGGVRAVDTLDPSIRRAEAVVRAFPSHRFADLARSVAAARRPDPASAILLIACTAALAALGLVAYYGREDVTA